MIHWTWVTIMTEVSPRQLDAETHPFNAFLECCLLLSFSRGQIWTEISRSGDDGWRLPLIFLVVNNWFEVLNQGIPSFLSLIQLELIHML